MHIASKKGIVNPKVPFSDDRLLLQNNYAKDIKCIIPFVSGRYNLNNFNTSSDQER